MLQGPRSAASLALPLVVSTLAVYGISAQESSVRGVQVDTLRGGRIVISNPDPTGMAPSRVPYVADRQANDIRVFSPEGECLRVFGGAGEGPGEFAMLAGIAWQEPGLLWGMDALHHRLTVFDSLGEVLATHTLGRTMAASLPWPLWVDDGANLHVWNHGERKIDRYAPGSGLTALDAFPIPEVEREFYEQTLECAGFASGSGFRCRTGPATARRRSAGRRGPPPGSRPPRPSGVRRRSGPGAGHRTRGAR